MVNEPAWAPPTLGQGAVGCGQGTKKRASGLMRHACRKFVSQRRNCKARCGRPRQLVKTGASFSRERLGEHVFAPDHADRFQQSRHRSTATVKKRVCQKEMAEASRAFQFHTFHSMSSAIGARHSKETSNFKAEINMHARGHTNTGSSNKRTTDEEKAGSKKEIHCQVLHRITGAPETGYRTELGCPGR